MADPITEMGQTIQATFRGPWAPAYGEFVGGPVGLGLAAVFFVTILIVAWAQSYNYYTPANLTIHTNAFIGKWEPVYGAAGNGRKSLNDYLAKLDSTQAIQPNQKCLSNFYIMTANAAATAVSPNGVLLSGLPICNIESLSYLLRAGCRGFIFDVHERLSDKGKPYITVSDPNPNKSWRTVSMNTMPFRDPINRLRTEAFGEGSLGMTSKTEVKNTMDPIFIYLRFVRLHKPEFYNNVANDLQNAFKNYRLDYTWAAGRRETDFYTTDVQEFMGKVVILSNQKAAGSQLEDMINITPASSVKANYTAADIKNVTSDEITKIKPIIQQHLCAAFDTPGSTEATNNTVEWARAHALGIQMVGMNFFTDAGNLQGYRDLFGEYSFSLKPEAMRYGVKLAGKPTKPGSDVDMKGGKITVPELQLRT